jgi:hypothetical protein
LGQDRIGSAVLGTSAAIVLAFSQDYVPSLLVPVGVVRQLRLALCLFQTLMVNQRLMLREVSFWRLEASVLLPAERGLVFLVERA